MRSITSIAALLAATLPLTAGAEEPSASPGPPRPDREWRLSIGAGSHNVSWPLRTLRPVHAAGLTSVETPLARTRFGDVPLRLTVAGFSDGDFNLGGGLVALEGGQRFRLPGGVRPEASLVLGYMGSRDTREGFRQVDGDWERTRGDVQSSLVFGAGASVELALRGPASPSGVVLAYRWLVQTPYVRSEEPLNAHGVWSVALTFPFRSRGGRVR